MTSTALRRLLGLLMALSAGLASATPLSYDESLSGDLDGVPTLALGVGMNTIRGDMKVIVHPFGSAVPVEGDYDDFYFTLPAGTALTAATIQAVFTNTTGQTSFVVLSTHLIHAGFTLSEGRCSQLLGTGTCQDFGGDAVDLAPGVLPLLSEPIFALGYGLGIGALDESQNYGGAISYEVTLVVQAVDEPAAMFLAALGLLMLLGQGRRRVRSP